MPLPPFRGDAYYSGPLSSNFLLITNGSSSSESLESRCMARALYIKTRFGVCIYDDVNESVDVAQQFTRPPLERGVSTKLLSLAQMC